MFGGRCPKDPLPRAHRKVKILLPTLRRNFVLRPKLVLGEMWLLRGTHIRTLFEIKDFAPRIQISTHMLIFVRSCPYAKSLGVGLCSDAYTPFFLFFFPLCS